MRYTYMLRDHAGIMFGSLAGLIMLGGYFGIRSTPLAFPALSANSNFAIGQSTTTLVAPAVTVPPLPSVPPGLLPGSKRLGINLWYNAYWGGERAFMNLTMQSGWGSVLPGQGANLMDESRINPDGSVKSLQPNEYALLLLTPPAANAQGYANIRCTWVGDGDLVLKGSGPSDVVLGDHSIQFKWTLRYPDPASSSLELTRTNPANLVRDIDCREVGAPRTKLYADEFVQALSPYGAIRFVIWQNTWDKTHLQQRWATRQQPNSFVQTLDGVAIENMVELARLANADPWFNIPWNGDEEYVTRFAQYVHDNLPAGRRVYVEVDNEVWNYGYRVTEQAKQEGEARGLGMGHEAVVARYAQKTAQVMKIWTRVFADNPSRLVRVAASQNSAYWAERIMSFGNTADYVDALAVAPYFGDDIFYKTTPTSTPDEQMLAMAQSVDERLGWAQQVREVASRFNKRFITYEAGQHVVTQDLAMQAQIQRNPKMYDVYRKYLVDWRDKVGGDLMMMFAHTGPISWSGAWGLREYNGQPLGETPKRRAVLDYLASN